MHNPLQNVRPGQRVQRKNSAQTENMVRDAARAHHMSKLKWGVRTSKTGGDRSVTFTITEAPSGEIGFYYGKSIVGPDATASGPLTEADLGTVATSEDIVAWHTPEILIGATKHLLALGGHYVGTDTGLVNEDGLRIVKFSTMPVGETASPTTIGDTDEGSETADTAGWSRAADGTPVTLVVMTRVAYFHGGDKKLYGYLRVISWDAAGLLLSVSAETRIEIDAAAAC